MCRARLGVSDGAEQLQESALYPSTCQHGPVGAPPPENPKCGHLHLQDSTLVQSPLSNLSPALSPALLPAVFLITARGKGTFYHITALLLALQGLPIIFKKRSRLLMLTLKDQRDQVPVEPLTTNLLLCLPFILF